MNPLEFERQVAATIGRYRMASPGEPLLVAVSGGADSVCLTRVLAALGHPLRLAHVNHGLRGPESDEDERFVAQLAATLGAPVFARRIQTSALGGNLEASARRFRRAFFQELLEQEGLRRVGLAHSLNDRAETFLLHLLRGSGTGGLASMKPVSGPLIRPLITSTRPRIEAYLNAISQNWREDSSNRDLAFSRNRVRLETLPRLTAGFNPRLSEALARTAEIVSDEEAWMEEEARTWVAAHLDRGSDPSLRAGPALQLDIGDLGARPVGFVRRVLRRALRDAGSDLADIGFEHIEQIRRILEAGKSGRVIELPGTIHVERSFETLIFRTDRPAPADYEYELPIPGTVRVPEAGLEITARVLDEGSRTGTAADGRRALVDGECLGPYVKIRNWKNGDSYGPRGLPESKLKTLFQQRRIPRSQRLSWPVFVARSSIVWVASFPVAREFVPTDRSRSVVEFEASPSR